VLGDKRRIVRIGRRAKAAGIRSPYRRVRCQRGGSGYRSGCWLLKRHIVVCNGKRNSRGGNEICCFARAWQLILKNAASKKKMCGSRSVKSL